MKKITTKQISMAGMFIAITVTLGLLRIGFIPSPTAAREATLMHIPVIIASIIEGPFIGGIIGFVFGLFTLRDVPDPLVTVMPRIFIGVVAYYSFILTKKLLSKISRIQDFTIDSIAAGVAALFGSLYNSVSVLGMAVVRHIVPYSVAVSIFFLHAIFEALIAVIIIIPIFSALRYFSYRKKVI